MILSGWKRSATARAKARITRIGMSAPRYQRGRFAASVLRWVLMLDIGRHLSRPAGWANWDWRSPRMEVPHPHRTVPAAADDAFAIGADRHAPDMVRVTLEGEEFLA